MEELISIIIPVHNVAEYLPACIDSLLVQTYHNIEMILVDDGSTDDSGIICDRYAAQDERIRVIHQQNLGVSAARTAGLQVSAGSLIGFVDSDDWIEPNMYQVLAQRIKETQSDAAFSGYYEYLPDAQKPPLVRSPQKTDVETIPGSILWAMKRNGFFVSVWNKLFTRNAVFRGGQATPFPSDLSVGEDEVWLMQVLTNCRSVAFTPAPLYHWRSRQGSASRSERLSPKTLSVVAAKKRVLELVAPYGSQLENLAKARLYNDSYHVLVAAYCAADGEALASVHSSIDPAYGAWRRSREVLWQRKIKVVIINLCMRYHMKASVISRLSDVGRLHKPVDNGQFS